MAARARDEALSVLRGAPVAVDVICVDRAGAVVGRSVRPSVNGPTYKSARNCEGFRTFSCPETPAPLPVRTRTRLRGGVRQLGA